MGCCGGPQTASDFDDEAEGLSACDIARFGADDITCPNCRDDIYADSPVCPRCGHAIMLDEGESARRGPGVATIAVTTLVILVVVGILL